MFLPKKVYAFCVLFSLAFAAKAQQASPIDMATLTRGLSAVNTVNTDMTKLNVPDRCPSSNNPGATVPVVGCGTQPEDFNNTVVTKIDFEPGKIDPRLKGIISEQFIKDTKDKKTSCLITLELQNDNKELLGFPSDALGGPGDDMAKTHKLGVNVSCTSEDGLSKTFSYDSTLFSERVKENGFNAYTADDKARQKFISETVFSVVQDNIKQNKLTYWKRGVGFINVTDKKTMGPLSSANQQEWFHGVVNKVGGDNAITYQYEEGSLNKWAPFVTMSMGLQKHASLGNRCHIGMAAETGFSLGTIEQANYWNATANAKVSYDVTRGSAFYLRGRYDATDRAGSSFVQERSVAFGFNRIKSGTFLEVGVTNQKGNRTDVYDAPNMYTGKNDSMIFMRLGFGF